MGTYSLVSIGTVGSSATGLAFTPGAPAGLAIGHQLRLFTSQRTTAATVAALASGWVKLVSKNDTGGSLEIWFRNADGTAGDAPSVDWSAATFAFAWLEAWAGAVYTDLSTIVAHSATQGGTDFGLYVPAVTGTTVDNCQLVAFGAKNGTATGGSEIITPPATLTLRGSYVASAINARHGATATQDQTAHADYGGADFTISGTPGTEAVASMGAALYIRTALGMANPMGGKFGGLLRGKL